MPNPISQPTYPAPMVESDLQFSALMDVMIADDIYFGIGTYMRLISIPSMPLRAVPRPN
ncbi:hypothetical protein [Mesotoga sp.]|uniref:hypothetical protein n=1 Tax=Mesotoga sp. TaxID=2053577 RepID=UPI003562E1A3